MDKNYCVVLLTNDAYFDKMIMTLSQLFSVGYKEDVCIVIGDDLKDSEKLNNVLLNNDRLVIKHFKDLQFSSEFIDVFNTMKRDEKWGSKIFQYHKLYLFHIFFKKWDYILYIDSGVTILNPITPILECVMPDKVIAHSDSYPDYNWKMSIQFDVDDLNFLKYSENFNFEVDYPQTTILLYDTNIINADTFEKLYKLSEDLKCSKTNDQGIIALYLVMNGLWKQIPVGDENFWYYDYELRWNKKNKPHIMIKNI